MAVWEARIKQGAVTSVYFETWLKKKKKASSVLQLGYTLDQVLETVVCHYFFYLLNFKILGTSICSVLVCLIALFRPTPGNNGTN